nr:hypothetical protein [Algoriphagus sp. Y33]
MKYLSIKVQVGNPEIPDLKAAESTAVKQGYQDVVFEQFGSFEKLSHFFLAENGRKLLTPLDGRQFDPFVLHPFDAVCES